MSYLSSIMLCMSYHILCLGALNMYRIHTEYLCKSLYLPSKSILDFQTWIYAALGFPCSNGLLLEIPTRYSWVVQQALILHVFHFMCNPYLFSQWV